MSRSAKTTPDRRATYRLQLHRGFGFDAAAGIADYLAALGISHVYTSPYLQAAPGSTHGYDVVDHARVNDELGGPAAHRRFLEALRKAGLRQVIDVVPNHMAIGGRGNRWWWDVLKRGPASPFARFFDIDWYPPEERLRNVLLLPILGDQYGRVLEAGEIRIVKEDDGFVVHYHDHRFPLADGTLPPSADLAQVNASPDELDAILDRQFYRLAWWQAAQRDLGYRRFFDVNTLVGLNIDSEPVFDATHAFVLGMVEAGDVDGLRIDHPDGLRDPEAYLQRVRARCTACHVVVEKILEGEETLPDAWPVQGTTGYDFMNVVLGLFVDPAGEAAMTRVYANFTGDTATFEACAREKKLLVLRDTLGSDVNRLAESLLNICERHRRHRDFTRHHLTEALRELLADFPVYRSYVRPGVTQVGAHDRAHIEEALRRARAARPDIDPPLLDFIGQILTLQVEGAAESDFVVRFQQLSAPAMAKGVEDTAFYTYTRFIALNEVGGDPGRFGIVPEHFHAAMRVRQERWWSAMSGTDTHDTKRGEDVRARLAVLSQMPDEWSAAVAAWSAMNEQHRGGAVPDRGIEYFLYQTLVGAWPIERNRVLVYAEKAAREAKVHTTWTSPSAPYEQAQKAFIEGMLSAPAFVRSLEAFVARVIEPGRVNSLAQVAIKLMAPGVPDFYQGTELWAHSLVDPDNRRPVDFERRRALLHDLDTAGIGEIVARGDEALTKMRLIRRGLKLRCDRLAAFGEQGTYTPLAADGPRADRVVAFARGGDVICVVPRLMHGRSWDGTTIELPDGGWCDVVAGGIHKGRVKLETLLARFPVALLARETA